MEPGEYYLLIYSFGPGGVPLYWDEKVALAAGFNSFTVGMENRSRLDKSELLCVLGRGV